MKVSRRRFCQIVAGSSVALSAPGIVRAMPTGIVGANRLWVIRAYDGEQLDAPIKLGTAEGTRNAWMLWSHYWRDVKDGGQAVWIDMRLLESLSGIQVEMSRLRGEEVPLMLNSGYRTPERNAGIEGAAPNSLHCTGCAADFVGRGFSPRETADLIDKHPRWGGGGLGRYADFTHIDTSRQRRWGRN